MPPEVKPAVITKPGLPTAARPGWKLLRHKPSGFLLQIPNGWHLDKRKKLKLGGLRHVIPFARKQRLGKRVVYVKSWGRLDCHGEPERESEQRAGLRDWIVDDPHADGRVMHCLPVRRNVVISSSVLDSDRSLVVDQAENRLWAQAGLLSLLGRRMGVL